MYRTSVKMERVVMYNCICWILRFFKTWKSWIPPAQGKEKVNLQLPCVLDELNLLQDQFLNPANCFQIAQKPIFLITTLAI